jgi:hypothetical protein
MNERIKELAQIAQKYVDDNKYEHDIVAYHHGLAFRDKFAKLIVLECAVIVGSMEESNQDIATKIKEHFGIE